MKVFFDTSVLVSAVIAQLPKHESALAAFVRYTTRSHKGYTSPHALAEVYATLTALPLQRRISPDDALRLIEENFESRLTILPMSVSDYHKALMRVREKGLTSGAIYDALHLICAEKEKCQSLLSFNARHFTLLHPSIQIVTP